MQKQKAVIGFAKPYPDYFSGTALVQQLADADLDISMVYFEPGARTKPHIHSHDQYLFIQEGNGLVAIESEVVSVAAGDVICIPADVWHWHGAGPEAAMAHLAITLAGSSNFNVDEKNWQAVGEKYLQTQTDIL